MSNFSDFNPDLLQCYLTLNNVIAPGSGTLTASKFPDGQSNPTYLLTWGEKKMVLRKQPEGDLLKSAHAVDREYRVMTALAGSGVPVPQTLHLCEDASIIGTPFFVMQYITGRIFWNPALAELQKPQRFPLYAEMAKVLSTLHQVDIHRAGLDSFGKPGNYIARQVDRWTKQYYLSETVKIPAMDALIKWLESHILEDDKKYCLVHGDYRLDNIIFDAGEPRIIALLDWELSTLGHPYADLAYQCMQLRMPDNELLPGLGSKDRKILGIPTETEYVALYCEHAGIPAIPHWEFYLAFSFFRFAAILQGVKKRAVDGNASSKHGHQLGELVAPLAGMALELV